MISCSKAVRPSQIANARITASLMTPEKRAQEKARLESLDHLNKYQTYLLKEINAFIRKG